MIALNPEKQVLSEKKEKAGVADQTLWQLPTVSLTSLFGNTGRMTSFYVDDNFSPRIILRCAYLLNPVATSIGFSYEGWFNLDNLPAMETNSKLFLDELAFRQRQDRERING